MVMLLDTAFYGYNPDESAFYTGGQTSSLVPDTFMVSLNGRPYMVDLNQPFYRQYKRQLAQLLRTQADTSKNPGESSLDPDALWRRSFEDWSLGAGQRYLDRDTSVPNRFWSSKGIDCLTTKWQISLLPDTTNVYSSASTTFGLAQATASGTTYLYVIDGSALKYTSNGSSWTTVTGTPGTTLSSICSDGQVIYVASTGGVYSTTAGSASATSFASGTLASTAVVGYVNGRLMVGSGNKLYNLVASGTLPSALFTAGNANFTFTNFADGQSYLYAAGTAGSQSYIYGVSVTSDGTTLGAPVVQGMLPSGETVTGLCGYLGYLIIGTTKGVRFATTSSTGVTLQSLIPVSGSSVNCAVGWNRFVYFGWTNYDGTSTGLGRMDLSNFAVAGTQPAYASDLMATAQGAVTAVTIFGGQPYFAVAGQGVYTQTTNLVASGTVNSGYILYGISDPKVACLLDCQTAGPLTYGSYSAALSTDGGTFNTVGLHTVGQSEPVNFSTSNVTGQRFEVQITLNRDGTTTTAGPTFTRFTLRSFPAPRRPLTWQLPLILNEEVSTRSGMDEGFDPLVELQAIEAMATAGQLVTYQEGRYSYQVFVEDVVFLPDYMTEDHHYYNGVVLVNLKGLPPTTS